MNNSQMDKKTHDDPMAALLPTLHDPSPIRQFDRAQLRQLAAEVRACVLDNVSRTGGHLSSNLGTVELTVALHHVFNTPHDRLVWDVGHQTYPHKILTGRRERMPTLRQIGGISGFPQRSESEYDTFGTAHSSTSISAALGMAMAAKQKGEDRHSVAIIGDGALTAGMAFEALNNAGVCDCKLLVILNDNDMSISPPVGALNRYLAQLMSGNFYAAAKNVGKSVLRAAPPLFELAKRFEQHAKGMVVPATLFEQFGFNYVGPIDGHDLDSLVPTLENLKHLDGPQFLHVVTKKGQGYKLAEADPVAYHGPGKFDPQVGLVKSTAVAKQTFTQVFGQWLCDMAAHDGRLVGITPAMREELGAGRVRAALSGPLLRRRHCRAACRHLCGGPGLRGPEAGGGDLLDLPAARLRPVDPRRRDPEPAGGVRTRPRRPRGCRRRHARGRLRHPFLRCIPNMSIACPADERECRQLLSSAYEQNHPVAVRYPRGAGAGVVPHLALDALPFGKGEVRREGKRIAILAFGTLLYPALTAAESLDATVVNMRWAKPLDVELLLKVAGTHDAIVTLEEGAVMGGAGSAVLEALQAAHVQRPVLQLGLPDRFIEHGDPGKLLASIGLDAPGIAASIAQRFGAAAAG